MATLPALVPEPENEGMDDSELASLLAGHEARSVGYYNSEIAAEQAKAIDYYYGIMSDLPALDGCSSAVDHSVAVMVDNGLAAVLKPFVSADEVVAFEPRGEEDVEQAEQATEYVNYVINCDNPGFLILHNWFKDALLTKVGIVKAWWEDQSRRETKEVGVDAIGLQQARQQPEYLAENDNGDGTYTVQVQQEIPDGRVKVENIPPEEFLVSPFTRSIDGCNYCAHRPTNYTRSDLLDLGFDEEVVDSLPAYAGGTNEETRSQARYRDEDWYSGTSAALGSDRSGDIIGIIDEYVRCDYDGDGVAEQRRVIRVDDVILFNEPVEDNPFTILCPVPMPHKIYGRSTADQSIEGQRISTAVLRGTLDNLYKSNNPRPVVGQGAIGDFTMDDLGETAPGAEIRVKDAGQLNWFTVPFTAQHSFPMLEYVAQQTEERTGVQRKGNGVNSEAIKKNSPDTATQAAIDENSRNERAEMIARIFAETGVKRLFKLILKLLVAHQPRERVIRLRNKWVPVDPRGWNPEMDLTVSIGLGLGNKAEQIMQADSVLQTMAELQQTPYAYLVDADKVHAAVKRKFTAAGIKNVDDYLVDPKETQPPPPQQDPKVAEAQAKGELEQEKLKTQQMKDMGQHQLAQAKAAADVQIQQAKAQAEVQIQASRLQLDQAKAAFEARLALQESQFDMMLERQKLAMQREMHSEKVAADTEIRKNRPGGDLDK